MGRILLTASFFVVMSMTGCRYVTTETSASHVKSHGGRQNEHITALHYNECGDPSSPVEDMWIDMDKHLVRIDCYYDYDDYRGRSNAYIRLNHICSESEWRFVADNIMRARLMSWKKCYADPDILDGTSWSLEIFCGTNLVKRCIAHNSEPDTFEHLALIKRFAMLHPKAICTDGVDDFEYVVKKGDDLASIAKELYIDVGDICIGTGLSRNQRLTPGMKLKFRALGCLRWKKSRL